jgi:hypothetical protein
MLPFKKRLRLKFRLQAVRLDNRARPPEGGTPNSELFFFVFTLLTKIADRRHPFTIALYTLRSRSGKASSVFIA